MNNIKGLLIDLDGVIVDTAEYHFLAWRRMANELGFDFNEAQNEQLKGVSRRKSVEQILTWGNISATEAEIEDLMKQKNGWYVEYINAMKPQDVLPGADVFLRESKAAGYKLALGSASKNAMHILDKLQLTSLFDAIIDGHKATKSKPDPEVFLAGATELGLAPEQCIVFEDAIAGVEAAHNGNMLAVGIGKADVLTDADVVYPGLNGLHISNIIKELTTNKA
jgi:beta-phosphoglucomutase